MTRRLVALAVLGAGIWLAVDPQDARAFGKKRGGCEGVAAVGGYAEVCGPSYTVAYEDREVHGTRAVWKSKKVEVEVIEYKQVEEKFDYFVNTLVPEKQKAKVCELIPQKQPYTYYTSEMVQVKDKAKVCQTQWKEEPYTYYENVMVPTKTKRIVYDTVCVPTPVTCTVPVHVPACGPCGPCVQVCMTTVTHTVMKPTVVPREILVDSFVCTPTPRQGKRMVPHMVWVEQDVMVWKCVQKKHDDVRIVHVPTWVDKDVEVMVCRPIKHEGKHLVCKPFPKKTTVDQHYCEYEPYKTVVKVPVLVPCAAPAPAPVAPCGPAVYHHVGHGGFHGGCCH